MALPSGWANQDFGSVGIAGTADYNSGTYTVQGSGTDIWDTSDTFQFAYKSLSVDGSIVARIASTDNTQYYPKIGVMIREVLDAYSKHAFVVVVAGDAYFLRRTTWHETTAITAGQSASPPCWVKLTRAGSAFSAFQSSDGNSWTQIGSDVTISMEATAYFGLAVCSKNNAVLNTTTFDNVSLGSGSPTALPRRALDGPFYGSLRGSVR